MFGLSSRWPPSSSGRSGHVSMYVCNTQIAGLASTPDSGPAIKRRCQGNWLAFAYHLQALRANTTDKGLKLPRRFSSSWQSLLYFQDIEMFFFWFYMEYYTIIIDSVIIINIFCTWSSQNTNYETCMHRQNISVLRQYSIGGTIL